MAGKDHPLLQASGDAHWYKDAIIYELHVRAFYDSNGDGVGDFRGLTTRLNYLQDLGVTAIWLLPFYPSPLRDDGYDIADNMGVHRAYGTLRDVRQLVREAHRRGLRVITELVCNHTSDQHPWFQRARRAKPGSAWRNFYVWSDSPDRYRDTRIIFKDFETSNWTWDPVAGAYYWHRFYSHQPDLNYDRPQVQKAILHVLDFWLSMGIDGLRLDAVPYLYEREGTNCENLPETHAFLRTLRQHVDSRFPNRMLLAEANQWPEHAATYFGDGDECHMSFHFPLMPRLFIAIRMEDRFPIIDILAQTPPIPGNSQWALFLRNHDELTLEMVTDEERDYMYRVYAHDPQARINLGIRRRLAPLLGNHRRRIELMNGLLFSLPGTPVVYYGDEIGMGDNIYLGDRNGVRTPMQWSADRNAGFSVANRQKLFLPVIVDPEYHYEAVNVEAQQGNPHSLLAWMKRLIALRKRYRAFGRGSLEFLHPENRKVLAFIRRYGDERILIVANLSRFVSTVELDLSAYRGLVPMELFGRTEFPPVEERPYFLTLAPHTFYWFALLPPRTVPAPIVDDAPAAAEPPTLTLAGGWEGVLRGQGRAALAEILPAWLQERRWFGGKARRIKGVEIPEVIAVPSEGSTGAAPVAHLLLIRVEYTEGDPETYLLPLAWAAGAEALGIRTRLPHAVVALVQEGSGAVGALYDALWAPGCGVALLTAIGRRRRWKGSAGEVVAGPTHAFRWLRGPEATPPDPTVAQIEQSHSAVIFGERFFLKLFRRLEEGLSPDLETGRFLTEKAGFPHIPPMAGAIEYHPAGAEPMTLAILQGYVPNNGDAWQYTLGALERYLERILGLKPAPSPLPLPQHPLGQEEIPTLAPELIGTYLDSARLLGRRTAELHLALAVDKDDPAFAPEPFTALYQRSLYQSMRSRVGQVLQLLRQRMPTLPAAVQREAAGLLDRQEEVLLRLHRVVDQRITALRIRCHGDYHLGQVLWTGYDFVVMDFEGEPARPLRERRIKRSPLADVAGMLRSFHYAVSTVSDREPGGRLEPWARFWHLWVSAAFLQSYLETAAAAPFLPRTREELAVLLDTALLEKAFYELGYELSHRPGWVHVPLRGILQLLEVPI